MQRQLTTRSLGITNLDWALRLFASLIGRNSLDSNVRDVREGAVAMVDGRSCRRLSSSNGVRHEIEETIRGFAFAGDVLEWRGAGAAA